MNVFAARLINLRKKRGLTQEELAKSINVTRAIISMVEASTREPSKELAKRLADFFQVPVELFIYKEDIQSPESTKKMISTAQILQIADIVAEYLSQNNYEILPEQRAALVEHFYQQNLHDADAIKQQLSVMAVLQSLPRKDK